MLIRAVGALVVVFFMTGCQDAHDVGYRNPCGFAVEAIDDSIRIVQDVNPALERYNVVAEDSTARIVVAETTWKAIDVRVRRAGSDEVGTLLSFRREDAVLPDDSELDFVLAPPASVCDRL